MARASWPDGWPVSVPHHSRSTEGETLAWVGVHRTDPETDSRRSPTGAESRASADVTVESASVIAIQTCDASDGAEAASTCRTPTSRARPTHRAWTTSASTPYWSATSRVASVQLSATTVTVAATPVRSRKWAAASRTEARHRPISSASLCAGMTTCTRAGRVGDRTRHASTSGQAAVGAQDERLEVRFGVADLDRSEACLLDRGVHLRAVEHPSDDRVAPVAQQEDAVRGERFPDPLDQAVEVSRAQEVADLGDHDQVERPSGQAVGHFCAGASRPDRAWERRQASAAVVPTSTAAGLESSATRTSQRRASSAVSAPTEHPTSRPAGEPVAGKHRDGECSLAQLVPTLVDPPRVALRRGAAGRGHRPPSDCTMKRSWAPVKCRRKCGWSRASSPGASDNGSVWLRWWPSASAPAAGRIVGQAQSPQVAPRCLVRAAPSATTRSGTPTASHRCGAQPSPPRDRPRRGRGARRGATGRRRGSGGRPRACGQGGRPASVRARRHARPGC